MNNSILAILALGGIVVAGGCQRSQEVKPAPKKVVNYSYIDDQEAHELGYPKMFVPKDQSSRKGWGEGHKEVINGEEVEVVDGPVVEVCGGNCDK